MAKRRGKRQQNRLPLLLVLLAGTILFSSISLGVNPISLVAQSFVPEFKDSGDVQQAPQNVTEADNIKCRNSWSELNRKFYEENIAKKMDTPTALKDAKERADKKNQEVPCGSLTTGRCAFGEGKLKTENATVCDADAVKGQPEGMGTPEQTEAAAKKAAEEAAKQAGQQGGEQQKGGQQGGGGGGLPQIPMPPPKQDQPKQDQATQDRQGKCPDGNRIFGRCPDEKEKGTSTPATFLDRLKSAFGFEKDGLEAQLKQIADSDLSPELKNAAKAMVQVRHAEKALYKNEEVTALIISGKVEPEILLKSAQSAVKEHPQIAAQNNIVPASGRFGELSEGDAGFGGSVQSTSPLNKIIDWFKSIFNF